MTKDSVFFISPSNTEKDQGNHVLSLVCRELNARYNSGSEGVKSKLINNMMIALEENRVEFEELLPSYQGEQIKNAFDKSNNDTRQYSEKISSRADAVVEDVRKKNEPNQSKRSYFGASQSGSLSDSVSSGEPEAKRSKNDSIQAEQLIKSEESDGKPSGWDNYTGLYDVKSGQVVGLSNPSKVTRDVLRRLMPAKNQLTGKSNEVVATFYPAVRGAFEEFGISFKGETKISTLLGSLRSSPFKGLNFKSGDQGAEMVDYIVQQVAKKMSQNGVDIQESLKDVSENRSLNR